MGLRDSVVAFLLPTVDLEINVLLDSTNRLASEVDRYGRSARQRAPRLPHVPNTNPMRALGMGYSPGVCHHLSQALRR